MRTHVALALAAGLSVIPYVVHAYSFFPILLLSTLLPDIDCMHSTLGKYKLFRPLQWFVKHRGMLHSLTFCLAVTLVLMLFAPVFALPFFSGYGLHLFGDRLTVEGIQPWWPLGEDIKGKMLTNGTLEKGVFYGLCVIILFLIMRLI